MDNPAFHERLPTKSGPMVDRLVGVAGREGADMSMLVTNSRFTSVAWKMWEEYVGRNLLLVDRTELFEWLKEYNG